MTSRTLSYRDIMAVVRSSSYSIDVSWNYLEEWLTRHKEEGILDLDPDFQRHHVWDDLKRTRYVEYILRGGRFSKDIFFNCSNYISGSGPAGPMQLVDGKQRMTAVLGWLRNEVSVFGGFYIKDMIGRPRGHVATFKVHVNDLETRAEVLQWYCDLNDGGVAHTPEEIRKVRIMLKGELEQQ